MRTLLTAVVTTAAMLGIGCGQSASPAAPTSLQSSGPAGASSRVDDPMPAAAPRGAQTIPFTGTLEGTVTLTPLDPPLANVLIVATGNATQLGRFTVEIPHQVSFATATGEGTYRFTAANGDMLIAHFTGTADTSTPVFTIVEHAAITGGTGRFTGATGSFTVRRLYDLAAGTTTGSIEGTIDK